jgi:phosphoribosylformylglycinamidine cyclo-ligase
MSLYSQRGVSAQKEDVHQAIEHLDKGLYPNAFCKILPDYMAGDPAYCNIMHADTAGTKTALAYLYWKETGDLSAWKGVVQDAVVMNIDDLICVGAVENIILSSTIGRNKAHIPAEVLQAVIGGCSDLLAEFAAQGIHIHLAGGETADVGDIVRTIDIGYTAFVRMQREKVVRIDPQPGDVIVGFASFGKASYETAYNSGIGSNGLTSGRHDMLSKYYAANYPETFEPGLPEAVTYIGPYRMTDPVTVDYKGEQIETNIGKLVLSPTRTYAPLVQALLKEHFSDLHGLVHCSGGGQTKCLKYTGDHIRMVKDHLFDPPPIFQYIQAASKSDDREMYQVFNMGHRLEAYIPAAIADSVIAIAEGFNIDAKIVGRVEASEKKELVLTGKNGVLVY